VLCTPIASLAHIPVVRPIALLSFVATLSFPGHSTCSERWASVAKYCGAEGRGAGTEQRSGTTERRWLGWLRLWVHIKFSVFAIYRCFAYVLKHMLGYWSWPPCVADSDITFWSCFFFFFSSSSSSSFFFSSPNLSGYRLDDYRTSTHGVARWKCRTQKSPKIRHFVPIAQVFGLYLHNYIDNRTKVVKQQHLPHTSSQYGELRPTNGWDPFGSLGHPSKFQRVSRLGSVTARHSSSGRQANFAALNRGRHLYLTGRPPCWALAHIVVCYVILCPHYHVIKTTSRPTTAGGIRELSSLRLVQLPRRLPTNEKDEEYE